MRTINLVYFSPAGTTEKTAAALAGELQADVREIDLLRSPPQAALTLEAPTIFVFPVYAGRIPDICARMLQDIHGQNTPAVAVVVYGNREYDDALMELRDVTEQNGFHVMAAAAFIGQHSIFPQVAAGRPDKQDLKQIQVFSRACNELLAGSLQPDCLSLKGNNPYRDRSVLPFFPTADERCTVCGVCADLCPEKAIPLKQPQQTDPDRCIACTACIVHCPQKARNFSGEIYPAARQAFIEKNATRKEPEFFLSSNRNGFAEKSEGAS